MNEVDADSGKSLIAYQVWPTLSMRIVPATASRAWIDQTDHRFATRCLPMLVANQSGWFLLSQHKVRMTWDGGQTASGMTFEYLKGDEPFPAVSHFGHGIVSWMIPFLFRTAPGYDLYVRGPANWPKDGAVALDGIVEADWAVSPFTMNWMLTRPGHSVEFDVDEPICMLFPQRRHELETWRPEHRDLASDPQLQQHYGEWLDSRSKWLAGVDKPPEAAKRGWQADYFRGIHPGGNVAADHVTRLFLRQFSSSDDVGG
ncbi:MAG: hypothetical protein JO057_23765 [Chloroflexi bacterium]|nr:hypothetical protein [Chloroflexota bacterium]